ncbi:fluoride efflux transporter CrcB [Sphingobium sufflavum]|uniref:fluoride efflux transporter CrcB n=1 Tax=Sphingobium sufflavum TaxID=1129547 RepID=UPI001F33050F|nr:fluoride efflux transporter CrcB [Sphingobium sufflavum]MCE7798609.1 fluoride efflux transporter CrcB [Sphingobium sufflavum]
MLQTILVMTGGAIGAALRYHAGKYSLALLGGGWPWGTLLVNVSGGLAMGLFTGWLALRGGDGEPMRLFVAIGVLGGFTTFSSFSLETFAMIERGEITSATAYILASVVASVGALAIGLNLGKAVA